MGQAFLCLAKRISVSEKAKVSELSLGLPELINNVLMNIINLRQTASCLTPSALSFLIWTAFLRLWNSTLNHSYGESQWASLQCSRKAHAVSQPVTKQRLSE